MATSSTVAVIPILGVVTQRGGMDAITCEGFRSTDDIAAEVQSAAADPKVDAIVLEVDSPGGEVFGVPEAWTVIREAAKSKPIVAAVNSVSASAAYYLSSAATEIWVTPSGQVGSIGVYCLHVDISKWLEDNGETWTFISAGKYKVEGNPAEKLSDEARAAIQGEIDRYFDMFEGHVAKGRGVSVKKVHAGFGEGRMVGATAAVEQGMADKVGTFEQAIRRAAQLGAENRKSGGAKAALEERELRAANDPTGPAQPEIADAPTPPAAETARAAALARLRAL
jgi:signal peptide peptidase SppA